MMDSWRSCARVADSEAPLHRHDESRALRPPAANERVHLRARRPVHPRRVLLCMKGLCDHAHIRQPWRSHTDC